MPSGETFPSGVDYPGAALHQLCRPGRSVVFRPICTAVIFLSLVANLAAAQEPPRTTAPPPSVALKRTVYEVRYGSAGELATVLAEHYAAESNFRAVAAASSNSLLLSAPPNVLDEVLRTLDQLDRRPRTFTVEVLFADGVNQPADAVALDAKALSGPADDVAARLDALKQQGRLTALRRIRLAATERQRASVNSGEEVAIVTPAQVFGGGRGGPVAANINRRNVGTLVELLPRAAPDGIVLLDLKVEDSRVVPDGGGGDGGQSMPVLTLTTVKGTVSIRAGQAAIATGWSENGTTRRQTAVIVSVRLVEQGELRGK
jgi:type II secretory pathway component GspD/PulD (secretin)